MIPDILRDESMKVAQRWRSGVLVTLSSDERITRMSSAG